MCGVFGVIGHPQAKEFLPTVLMSLQHRGHDSAGIAGFKTVTPVCLDTIKGVGKVDAVITHEKLSRFKSDTFICHTRYTTRNEAADESEIHPLIAQSMNGKLAIATNGDLIEVESLLDKLKQYQVKTYSKNDAEILAALINIQLQKEGKNIFQSIHHTMNMVQGGYAGLLIREDDNRLYAFRDPWGIRPLHVGEFIINGQKCVAVASETCAFDIIQRFNYAHYNEYNISYKYWSVNPGEIISIDSNSDVERHPLYEKPIEKVGCVFESIYFSRPDSIQKGDTFQAIRERMGMELFNEAPVEADMVTAVPKGGIPAAIGFSKASGIPFGVTILEEPTIGGLRSFTTSNKNRKSLTVMKYNILKDLVKDKRLIVVDDSIVRGTTARFLIKNLLNAGAKSIHLRIPAPPYQYPCHYGIETRNPRTLISHYQSNPEICREVGADSLAYLSLEGLYRAIGQDRSLFCDECFTNQSPIF